MCGHGGLSRGGTYVRTSSDGLLAGTALAGGFFCILYLLIGDIPHFAECFGLRRHSNYNPCDFCPVHNQVGGDPQYYRFNFALRATWKTSLYTAADWRNLYSALHVLFRRFLYLSQYNVEPDELHVMHLGVGQELLGSVLWYLVFIMMAGDAMSNMHAVWADVVDIYMREGIKTRFNTVRTQYATQWGNLQRRLERLGSQRLVVAERWHQVGAEGRHENDIASETDCGDTSRLERRKQTRLAQSRP